MDPPALRLQRLEAETLPALAERADALRGAGRLHQDSKLLSDLVDIHVRRIALARLALHCSPMAMSSIADRVHVRRRKAVAALCCD